MATHHIKASPATIQRGIISPGATPILTIASGDTVIFDTWSMWDNAAGADLTLDKALALRDRFRAENRGPHMLTGPIAVETAEPRDVLKVEIERLEIADHGVNIDSGLAEPWTPADVFTNAELRHFPLDAATMTAEFGNITIRCGHSSASWACRRR